jgi:hypothetical protein
LFDEAFELNYLGFISRFSDNTFADCALPRSIHKPNSTRLQAAQE